MFKPLSFIFFFISSVLFAQTEIRNLSKENWQFKNIKDRNWLKASVPGTVHTDLMNNKLISDPYLDENEKNVQWVENEDWNYQTTFTISKQEFENQHIDLIFEGLDTFSEVFLNGKSIGKTENMFRKWEFSVKNSLKIGENVLQVKFKSCVNVGKELAKKVPFQLPESPRSLVRKAQYQFGWDWGPRLVTAGIWKDVNLKFWNLAKLNSIQFEQKKISKNIAETSFNAEILSDISGEFDLKVNVVSQKINLKKGVNKISIPYVIKNPKLWQPNGWGESHLYDADIVLSQNKKQLEKQSLRFGLRTIELIQEKDVKGKSFYFKVNGKPLYAKGTNWIPSDSFLPRITKEKYQKLIKDAKEVNMNMIRIWGGGIYEDEEFYKACDENGILVWQDFAFAGSFYPSDENFQDNVREEVKNQVKRLQNHASLALWCGNNEVDEAIVNWGYQKQFKYSKQDSLQVWKDYKKIFHEVIPNALKSVSPNAIYWPSSPSIGWGHKESLTEGDSHYWGVWWGEQPFEIYNEKVPRFASEYGFQGMPSLETTKSMFSGNPDLNLQNLTIKSHQKHSRGWEIINNYMKRDYKIPTDFIQYNYVSQLLQSRGMQIGIEAHRRNKPYNMGTLIWQLNDCWPVVSWSAIDYLGNWKALHYQTKRSFEPQIISIEEEKNNIYNVFFINDDFERFSGELEVSLIDFKGQTKYSYNKQVSIMEDSSANIYSFNHEVFKGSKKDEVFMKIDFVTKNKTISKIAYFVPPKDLKLLKPTISIKKISSNEIEVSTDVFAKDIYLMGNTHFNDNFFDLLPNEKRKIELSKSLENIEVLSLWDTMK